MVGMRRILYGAAPLAFVLLALAYGCSSEPAPSAEPSERRAPRRGGRAAPPVESELDLQAMLSPVPEYEGQGRNLFIYGPEPTRTAAPAPPPPPPPPSSQRRPPAPPTAPRPAPRSSSNVSVKYAGFVEKMTSSGDKAKYAMFLDGNEILAGAEGETVAHRFTVIEIGLESVTVSAEGSSATQRIPLQAN